MSSSAATEPVADSGRPSVRPEGDTVARYRALHQAMCLAPVNFQAVIALAGVAMAQAQGLLERGPHARRQAMLAMAQALSSAGFHAAPSTLGLLFSELVRAGALAVERRPGAGPTGAIVEVTIVRAKGGTAPRAPAGSDLTLAWGPRDVESHPLLAISRTPSARAAAADATATVDAADAPHIDGARQASGGDAPVAVHSARTRRPPPLRSFWAADEADAFA